MAHREITSAQSPLASPAGGKPEERGTPRPPLLPYVQKRPGFVNLDIANGAVLARLQVTHDTRLADCKANTGSLLARGGGAGGACIERGAIFSAMQAPQIVHRQERAA